MNKRNPKDFLGFIKFVDDQYIDDFFNLYYLWLSNYRFFIGNKDTSEEDLINDKSEGRLDELQTNMPAFLTCFTLIEKDSFDETGILKDDISSALINSEKCMNKNRSFVYIPKENMECLLNRIAIINWINKRKKLHPINKQKKRNSINKRKNKRKKRNRNNRKKIARNTLKMIARNKRKKRNKSSNYIQIDIFTRFINYKRDYKDYMKKKEQELLPEFWDETHKPYIDIIEEIGTDMFCTKPNRFEVQNEFRIGKVLPVNEEYSQYKSQNGISIRFKNPITFATKKFPQSSLKNLNKIDLQNLNKEKKNEEGFKK